MSSFNDFVEYILCAQLKPKYIPLVNKFIADRKWDDAENIFRMWHQHLKFLGRYWIVDDEYYYDYTPPIGLECLECKTKMVKYNNFLKNDTWVVTGAVYNHDHELEFFCKNILCEIAEDFQCTVLKNTKPYESYIFTKETFLGEENIIFFPEHS